MKEPRECDMQPVKKKLDYTWVIVFACFMLGFFCLGFCSGNKGLYLAAITEALQLPRSLFSLNDSIRYLTTAAMNLVFATVLQKEMAARVIRMLAFNPDVRVNRNQSNASQFDLLYEVDGNPQGRKTGIGYELEKAYEALDLDTRGIDRLCMTCRPVGVRYRNV